MSRSEKKSRQRRREAFLAALDEQLRSLEVPEVKQHYDRLLRLGIADSEVRNLMASVLAVSIWHAMRRDDYAYADYVADLSKLPEIDWMDDNDTDSVGLALPDEDAASLELPRLPRRPIFSTMNTTDLMKDPFYAPILFAIESRIHAGDREAQSRDVTLTDSQVRSILNKVRKTAEGGTPQIPADSDREKVLAALYLDVVHARKELQFESSEGEIADLPTRDWLLALRTVEDSIRLRSTGAGSRAYLDFLKGFNV